jgi:hypothetical protein
MKPRTLLLLLLSFWVTKSLQRCAPVFYELQWRLKFLARKQIRIIILIIILIPFGRISVIAQRSSSYSKINLYGELGGPAFFLSGNLERLFPVRKSLTASGRIGLGIFPDISFYGEGVYPVVPISGSLFFGNRLALEVGGGFSVAFFNGIEDVFGNKDGVIKWFNPFLGFRYQKPHKGFLFRLGYTPMVYYNPWQNYHSWQNSRFNSLPFFGLSLGGRIPTKSK